MFLGEHACKASQSTVDVETCTHKQCQLRNIWYHRMSAGSRIHVRRFADYPLWLRTLLPFSTPSFFLSKPRITNPPLQSPSPSPAVPLPSLSPSPTAPLPTVPLFCSGLTCGTAIDLRSTLPAPCGPSHGPYNPWSTQRTDRPSWEARLAGGASCRGQADPWARTLTDAPRGGAHPMPIGEGPLGPGLRPGQA